MYHRIVSAACPIPGENQEEARYAVDLGDFEWQLRRIKAVGLEGVSMRMAHETLAAGNRIPPDQIVITFDDGNRSDYEHAQPLLIELGFSATFFVTNNRIGAEGGLEKEMLRAMTGDGLDVGSHGMTHRFLTRLSADDEEEEIRRSKDILEEITGSTVDYFAPPGGRIDQRGVSALKRLSFRAVCTSEFGYNDRNRHRFTYKRIPIVAAISKGRFQDILNGSVIKLSPLYIRAGALKIARTVLGEGLYDRFKSLGLRD
jgi:peptidoglycan/xylan/chitin deacetylase (PgdA/CDA1 family)